MAKGVIYIMTTIVPSLIKIGKAETDNCQLPAAKAAGLYDSTGQCSLSGHRHTPYPDTARLAALPQKTEQRSARLEGGSLASCHARGSIRFILYRIKDSYEP